MDAINGNPRTPFKQRGPRVVMISDRSPLNFEALADYATSSGASSDSFRQRFPLQVGGVITPGGEFTAQETVMRRMQLRERSLRTSAVAIPIIQNRKPGDETEEHIGSMHYLFEDGFEFRHMVLPYSMDDFKRDPALRKQYNDQLVAEIKAIGADIVFLDNFKLILDRSVAEEFKGRIVNVHPSVLPSFKGWRTEKAAFEQGSRHALGYTFHEVVPELDRGPVIFSTAVDFSDIQAEFEGALIDANLEEALRLRIIAHQSMHVSKILAVYGSDAKRKVVSGLDAFTTEGRPEFYRSDEYQELEGQEREAARENDGAFLEYSRMLFDVEGNGKYVTLESAIGIEQTGMFENVNSGIRTYRCILPDQKLLGEIITFAQERGAYRNMRFINTHPASGASLEITGTGDLEDVFHALGVDFEVAVHPSRVTSPRRQPESIPF